MPLKFRIIIRIILMINLNSIFSICDSRIQTNSMLQSHHQLYGNVTFWCANECHSQIAWKHAACNSAWKQVLWSLHVYWIHFILPTFLSFSCRHSGTTCKPAASQFQRHGFDPDLRHCLGGVHSLSLWWQGFPPSAQASSNIAKTCMFVDQLPL